MARMAHTSSETLRQPPISIFSRQRKCPLHERLSRLYQKLSKCYELLQTAHEHLDTPSEQAMAAVLEDDLQSLIEECEDYLIGGIELRHYDLESFQSRSATVVEELRTLSFLKAAFDEE